MDSPTVEVKTGTLFNCDPKTLMDAAKKKYGDDVQISAPYWVDHEILRIGVESGGACFGANFHYREGVFK